MEPLLTRSAAAKLIGKKESWLRYAELHRLIPYVKVGQQIRYRAEDIRAWVESRRIVPRLKSSRRVARQRLG